MPKNLNLPKPNNPENPPEPEPYTINQDMRNFKELTRALKTIKEALNEFPNLLEIENTDVIRLTRPSFEANPSIHMLICLDPIEKTKVVKSSVDGKEPQILSSNDLQNEKKPYVSLSKSPLQMKGFICGVENQSGPTHNLISAAI
ncbi:hypothetical protein AVEN_165077-1 [Araneus ventricosus]|uniref:Uncharacterized protein n=1 Tax=Araneus ventricosus TaxID=182803 RepID=A0A4Y2F9A1_ARAVE|nr:hypothetical protein AVEN_165077-1 [Araneus ventricosus]